MMLHCLKHEIPKKKQILKKNGHTSCKLVDLECPAS